MKWVTFILDVVGAAVLVIVLQTAGIDYTDWQFYAVILLVIWFLVIAAVQLVWQETKELEG